MVWARYDPRQIPRASAGVVGIFVYHGTPVPLIDLAELALGEYDQVDVRCPPNNGAKNWPSGAFSPMTHIYYFTLNENCVGSRMPPSTPDGKIGRLDAVNLDTRQEVWQFRDRSAEPSAVLATAGGLVFAGSYDRYLRAFDDRTGAVLWQMRVQDIVSTFPITYSVDGKQYIAISVGSASIYGAGLGGMHRELQMTTPPPSAVDAATGAGADRFLVRWTGVRYRLYQFVRFEIMSNGFRQGRIGAPRLGNACPRPACTYA